MADDFKAFQAPWEVYPEIPCGSIHWRMGAGEDVMGKWGTKFRALKHEQRLAYREMHVVPPAWDRWLDNLIKRIPREADEKEIARLVLDEDDILLSCVFFSPHFAEVKIAKLRGGPIIEIERILRLKRGKDRWEVQN